MLIDDKELKILGEAVLEMIEYPDHNPVEFWTISQKIIHGIIYSNKKMGKFPIDWKDTCEHNALVKVVGNIHKFSPVKWNDARNKSGLASVERPYKGVYEFIHLVAIRNIYNTINKLITNQKREKSMSAGRHDELDLADIASFDDFNVVDAKINVEWIEKRLGFKFEGDNDE